MTITERNMDNVREILLDGARKNFPAEDWPITPSSRFC